MASLDDKSQANSGRSPAESAAEPTSSRFERLPDPWNEARAEPKPAPAPPPTPPTTTEQTPPTTTPANDALDALLLDLQQVLEQPVAATIDRSPAVSAEAVTPRPVAEQPEAADPTMSEIDETPASAESSSESAPIPLPVESEADALLEKLQSLALDALNRQPLKPPAKSESSLEIGESAVATSPPEPEAPATEDLVTIPIIEQLVEPLTAPTATAPEPEYGEAPPAIVPDTAVSPELPGDEPDAAMSPEPESSSSPIPAAAFAGMDSNGAAQSLPLADQPPAEVGVSNGKGSEPTKTTPGLFRLGDRDCDPLDVLRELLLSPEPGVEAAKPTAPQPTVPKPPRRRPPTMPPATPMRPATPEPPIAKAPLEPDAAAVGSQPGIVVRPLAPGAATAVSPQPLPSAQEVETTYLRQLIADLEQKLVELEKQVYQPTDVINPLLPLIAQLMKQKTTMNEDAVYTAVVPVLDRAIRERSDQNHAAMSEALAELIPDAIAEEIRRSPETIAKSLGPEMAAALREQIKLEKDSISRALGPEMGRAIKEQIELERDAMVDALYPVIGNTIAKYMGEVVAQINERVETALSPAGLRRKMQAKLQGVSEAELILQESMPTVVQAIFLIHKASGLVISELQPSLEARLEPNMIAGMLTAIRSFVNDCIAQSGEISELNEIEYGDSRIVLEVAGYCYLAVVVRGTPRQAFVKRMQRTLMLIVRRYGREIEEFDGDSSTLSPELHNDLAALGDSEIMTPDGKPRRRSRALLWLILAILALIVLPWSIFQVRGFLARRLETKLETALADLDAQTYTTLDAEVRGGA
ncbi:MAG: hypothetical protein HC838_04510 [Spirulinaceae cyanobacterium RM2_2_10]|nr:hypothetical protein [Spirulinaceae cyanobacterium RM2_2_10]